MRDEYFAPKFKESKFHCIKCGVLAHQTWFQLYYVNSIYYPTEGTICFCVHCKSQSYWVNGKLVHPATAPVEPAHPDLPSECQVDYEEACTVFVHSPRASAALIRLAIQKLMVKLGESGKNINNDIKSLVSKGLPVMIQQALDVCRVVGNNAVHPGEMDLNDTPEITQSLFRLINIIVDERITKPKEILQIYNSLPQGARDAITKRDSTP